MIKSTSSTCGALLNLEYTLRFEKITVIVCLCDYMKVQREEINVSVPINYIATQSKLVLKFLDTNEI